MAMASRVATRLKAAPKKFQPVLAAARDRDVSEADTVTLVKDMLCEVFGYDKYSELTSEYSIRGTYCDLAVRIEGKPRLLLEVKAAGTELNDKHVKQAIDYAANQGIEWVSLTNGIHWMLFHVLFQKPIDKALVAEFDLLTLNMRSDSDLEKMYLLTREGLLKGALPEYRERQDATSRFMLAAFLLNSEAVLSALRREIRRATDMLVDHEEIAKVLKDEVIKRECLEGDAATEAARRVKRQERSRATEPKPMDVNQAIPSVPPPTPVPAPTH